MTPLKIYVSGPYTLGDRTENVRNAMMAGKQLMSRGHHPYIPHLSFFFDLMWPHEWDRWMELDLAFLKTCDALIRLPGESKGADREVEFAHDNIIVVFNHIDEVPYVK